MLAFLEAGIDPLDACEKPFVDSPSARMVTRRLRLRDGDRPSARPDGLGSFGDATARVPASSGEAPIPAGAEGSGLLEARRRRRGLGWAREDGWGDRYSDEGESGLPSEAIGRMGTGSSGWSGAKGSKGGLLARSKSRDLPSPLALWKEPGEQIYRRVDSSSPFKSSVRWSFG